MLTNVLLIACVERRANRNLDKYRPAAGTGTVRTGTIRICILQRFLTKGVSKSQTGPAFFKANVLTPKSNSKYFLCLNPNSVWRDMHLYYPNQPWARHHNLENSFLIVIKFLVVIDWYVRPFTDPYRVLICWTWPDPTGQIWPRHSTLDPWSIFTTSLLQCHKRPRVGDVRGSRFLKPLKTVTGAPR
jgi:hypothetical protein